MRVVRDDYGFELGEAKPLSLISGLFVVNSYDYVTPAEWQRLRELCDLSEMVNIVESCKKFMHPSVFSGDNLAEELPRIVGHLGLEMMCDDPVEQLVPVYETREIWVPDFAPQLRKVFLWAHYNFHTDSDVVDDGVTALVPDDEQEPTFGHISLEPSGLAQTIHKDLLAAGVQAKEWLDQTSGEITG